MEYMLRRASKEDCDLIFDWANDPVVRAAAFHTEPIPYKSHIVWYHNLLNNPNVVPYIFCEKETKKPVAQIRFAIEEGKALISYSVSSEYRGCGIGTKMIQMAQEKLLKERPEVTTFVAQVKYENPASARIFEKCGYVEEELLEYKEFTCKIQPLFIRVDGNKTIGLGHVMRCLSIADAASKMGFQVQFLVADDSVADLIMDRDYNVIILGTDYQDMEAELPVLYKVWNQMLPQKDAIEKKQPLDESENALEHTKPLCLVDSYQMTESYLKQLSQYMRVAVLDDLFAMDYPVDMVINYNIYGDLLLEKETKNHDRKHLTGVSFAPLREQFILKREELISQHEKNEKSGEGKEIQATFEKQEDFQILISTGGSDSLCLAEKISRALMENNWCEQLDHLNAQKDMKQRGCEDFRPLHLHIVCGALNPNKEALLSLEKEYQGKITVHMDVQDMAGLMSQCDMAVTAAGSTVYELSTLGIPFVLYYFVENQKLIAEHAKKILGVTNAGDFSTEPENQVMDRILDETKHLYEDTLARKKLSMRLSELVDGRGADRIAKEFRKLINETKYEA